MGLLQKNKTKFITVTYPDTRYAIDYPKDLPLPRKGDRLQMNYRDKFHSGIVSMVTISVTDGLYNIRIDCEKE